MVRKVTCILALLAGAALASGCGEVRSKAIRLDVEGTNALLAGEVEGAVTALREAVGTDPSYIDALSNLATAYRLGGRFAEAAAACRQALEAEGRPDGLALRVPLIDRLVPTRRPRFDETSRFNLVQIYHEQGKVRYGEGDKLRREIDRAVALFDESSERIPGFRSKYLRVRAELELTRGHSYMQMAQKGGPRAEANIRAARAAYDRAIAIDPEFGSACLLYANACMVGGSQDRAGAYRRYKRYLELGGSDPDAQRYVEEWEKENERE